MSTPTLQLSDLLAAARAKVEADDKLAAAKAKANDRRVSEEERTAANAEARAIEEARDWRPTALVFAATGWQCRCGSSGVNPEGLFIKYEHTRLANCQRLARPRSESDLPQDLPRRYKREDRIVSICSMCRIELGFQGVA